MTSLRTKLEEPGRFLCGVGPFALGGSFPAPLARNTRAFEDPVAVDGVCAETPSIIFAIFGLDACSSVLGFLRRLDRDAAALACLAASTGGSSFTSAYSLSIRDLKAIFWARSAGDAMGGAIAGRGELSSAVGAPKSAAKISRVRLADLCTNSDGAESIVVVIFGCLWKMGCRDSKCNFLVETNFGASSPHFITEPSQREGDRRGREIAEGGRSQREGDMD